MVKSLLPMQYNIYSISSKILNWLDLGYTYMYIPNWEELLMTGLSYT